MYKQIATFAITVTLALLMYPLSLPSQNSFSISLDANSAAGDQAATSVNTSADQNVSIQVFGSNVQNANAFGLRFEYDTSQVTYQGFDAGRVLPGTPYILPQHGTNPTYVEIGLASLGSQATVNSGLVGIIRFRTTAAFSGTAIRLVSGKLSRGGNLETVTLTARVELQAGSVTPSPDFDGDGTVSISDFLLFVNHFGLSRGDVGYDAKYDLDSNDGIGISDFLLFVNNFGNSAPPSGGGSGGSDGGTPPISTPFRLDSNNSNPQDITYANNRFYVLDLGDWDLPGDEKVYAYTSLGQRDPSEDFNLDSNNSGRGLGGITYANNRFYVVDRGNADGGGDEKVYAYTSLGQRDPSEDFNLDSNNGDPTGITYANNRFYVVDGGDEKVYVYTSSGQHVSSSDFNLDSNNSGLTGITYANNRFYMVDYWNKKVYAYTSLGQRDPSEDFDLDSNSDPTGITYANNRFYVLGWFYKKVYAYTSLGQRDPSEDFDLDSNNGDPTGITYANNRFYVVDILDEKVYAYTSLGQRDPSEDFDLDYYGSQMGITYVNNRFYVVDEADEKVYAYTSLGQRDPSEDFNLDSNNSDPNGITYANNRFYVVDAGNLREAGDEKVYAYTSLGQRDSSSDFNLDSNNSIPNGITYANNRFYVVDWEDDYVYAYTSLGQRDSSSGFNLDSNNSFAVGILYVNNRFYVVDGEDDKVYVYMSPEYSGGGGGRPDLIVEAPLVITSSPGPNPRESFTLGVTVRNQGNGPSAATTLRYYRSSNATISINDTEVGTDSVSGLSASDTSDESISLNAPSSAGTYYYGACVDNVSGESDTGNNCSSGVPVAVQAAGDDHSNTRSGATSLVNSRSGRIETGSDVDYFRVQVSEYGVLTVYTTGNLDTYGTLQNSSGTTLETDDDDGDGTNFGIAYIVNSGTYYIKVEGAYFATTGSYTIHATFDRDDSNTRSGATFLSLDTLSSGSLGNTRLGWIETGSDVDYFRVQLNRSGVLTVYTTGNLDTYGTLQNSSGTTLETDDDGGYNSNFAISRFVVSGTYYIKVEGYSSSDIGRYYLNVLLE